jgi:CDGSH-type Zn-finger protein
MATPRIADRKPMEVQFEKSEELHWCACGKSANQPFCDGSHAGSEFTPVAFEAKAGETVHLCMCKHTGTPPFCDGTHATLSATGVEPATPKSDSGSPPAVPTPEEPHMKAIHDLARDGLAKVWLNNKGSIWGANRLSHQDHSSRCSLRSPSVRRGFMS